MQQIERTIFATIAALLCPLGIDSVARADDKGSGPPTADIRQSIERGLPYLEKEGNAWISDRKCLSCHVVSFMLWSLNEAKAHDIKLDVKKFDDSTRWSLDYSLNARQWYKLTDASEKVFKADGLPEPVATKLKPLYNETFVSEEKYLEKVGQTLAADELSAHKVLLVKGAQQPPTGEKNDGGSIATLGQLLLGRSRDKSEKLDAFLEAAPAVMRKWQQPNGSWKAAGQLPRQNRPSAESDETTTGWAILGLASIEKPDTVATKCVEDGLAFFKKTKPGKSHENLLVHLLVEDKLGKTEDAADLLQAVLKSQNDDGGWAWLPGGASDAYATGQTLYALTSLKAKVDRTVIQRSQKYLLDIQHKDGYWEVPPKAITDPKSDDGRVQKLVPIYKFWGTAWAAIGLAHSL